MLSNEEKIYKISEQFKAIMDTLGLDLANPSLKATPLRVAKMYVNELCAGLDTTNAPTMTAFPNDEGFDQIVLVRDIGFVSLCEHHFLPYHGKCHIAYLPAPDGNILGLSKFNRFVQHLSAKPSVQERLTQQIYDELCDVMGTEDIAVVIQAQHLCCAIRGAKDPGSSTLTSYLGGLFRTSPAVKEEFFNLIQMAR